MDIQIADIEELSSFIGRAYWLESQMELILELEAYMVVPENFRDVLFQISHDSTEHKVILKKLATNLDGLDLNKSIEKYIERKFDFKNMMDEEIMGEILKYERLSLDIYERLYLSSGKKYIEIIWTEKDYMDYFKILKWLIAQEKYHIELIKPFSGKIERIP